MDLGAFRRSRTALLAWIVLPVLVLAVAYYGMHVYCRHVDESLQRRRAFMEILPGIRSRLSVAGDVVLGFTLMEGARGDTFDAYQSRLGDLARQNGFVINSLMIEERAKNKTPSKGKDRPDETEPLVLRIKGEGVLTALMKFLNDVQSPQSLTTIDEAKITISRYDSVPVYGAELVLRCDCVK